MHPLTSSLNCLLTVVPVPRPLAKLFEDSRPQKGLLSTVLQSRKMPHSNYSVKKKYVASIMISHPRSFGGRRFWFLALRAIPIPFASLHILYHEMRQMPRKGRRHERMYEQSKEQCLGIGLFADTFHSWRQRHGFDAETNAL